MFVCTVKASTVKFVAVIGAACVLLAALIIMLPPTSGIAAGSMLDSNEKINYEKVRDEDARKSFLAQFGWDTKEGCVEEVEIRIPEDFDKVMNAYNEVQRSQGLDLSKYKGKTVNRYTYYIENYPDYDGTVLANIVVYKNRVIGGDICSSDAAGFIHGFAKPSA